MNRRVRFVSTRPAYRRGGLDIGSSESPTIIKPGDISAEAFRKIVTDPNVETAVESEPDVWVRLTRAELDLAIEAEAKLTGQRAQHPAGTVPGATDGPADIVSVTGEALAPSPERLAEMRAEMLGAQNELTTMIPHPGGSTALPDGADRAPAGDTIDTPAVDTAGTETGTAPVSRVAADGAPVSGEAATTADPVPAAVAGDAAPAAPAAPVKPAKPKREPRADRD